MNENLISFETAKLSKEKGFNIWNDSYSLEGVLIPLRLQAIKVEECKFPAPTQSLLQKWLRDNFHIHTRVACNSLTSYFPVNEVLSYDGSQLAGPKYLKNYKSYEEALEVGLFEALMLIKSEKIS